MVKSTCLDPSVPNKEIENWIMSFSSVQFSIIMVYDQQKILNIIQVKFIRQSQYRDGGG